MENLITLKSQVHKYYQINYSCIILQGGTLRFKYFRQFGGNILTLKRFSIKLTTILVGNPLTFQQLA